MPPSIVLEVLRITEREMDLRSLTKETEQSRRAMLRADFREAAHRLAEEQTDLVTRTELVMEDIRDLPEGEEKFRRELARLGNALAAMEDAEAYLSEHETGPVAVAAETEAIEHLLAARRGGNGGGGGGSSPGGGLKRGQTNVTALALAGRSDDALGKVGEREVRSATGRSTEQEPPVELRGLLDDYFERLNAK